MEIGPNILRLIPVLELQVERKEKMEKKSKWREFQKELGFAADVGSGGENCVTK